MDNPSDDTRPVKIAAGLALLALLGAWLANPFEEQPNSNLAGAQSATAGNEQPLSPAGTAQGSPGDRRAPESGVAETDAQHAEGAPATGRRSQGTQASDRNVSANVGRSLTNIVDLLNAGKYDEATAALDLVMTADAMANMTPFEISRLYQLSFNLNMQKENYEAAQADLQAAIESGGLNAQEMSQMQYQSGQLFVQMEDYAKAADSLELWIAQEGATANPGAYYLLAASYYYQDKFDDARDHMETLFAMPGEKQEGWYSMLASLYMRDENYAKALPVVEKMVELYGDETYQKQLNDLRRLTQAQ